MATDKMVQGILDRSREVLAAEQPDLLDALEPLMDAAEGGSGQARDIFMRAVAGPNGVDIKTLTKLLAGLASTSITGIRPVRTDSEKTIPEGEVKLPPDMIERTAIKRVWNGDFDLTKQTPAEIDIEIFKGIEYAKEERVDPDIPVTIGDEVMAELAERMGRFMIDALRAARTNGVEIAPPPTSEKYDEMLIKMIGFKPEVLEAWQSWTHWKSVMAYQFVGIIIYNVTYPKDPIERIERAIESRRKWYNALAMFDVEDADIERAIGNIYKRGGGHDDVRALGEYRRFVKPDDESLMENPAAAGLLGSAILALHKIDPSLDQERFIELLPHYAYPMTMESCLAMLARDNPGVNGFYLYKAQAVLMWHMEASTEQIDSLASMVRRTGRRFGELESFCRKMLGVRTVDLLEKIEGLARQGFYPEPLAIDIQETFPGEIEFDLDAMRNAADSPDGGTEIVGIVRETKAEAGEAEDEQEAAAAESADAAAAQAAKGAEQLTLGFAVMGTAIKPKV